MIDISRHIEYLLLEHDMVSVPQLGTFSIEQSASRWVEDEDLFLPPVRNVSFTPDCTQQDDEFVRSLASALRISVEQSQAACAEYVVNMRQQLADNSVAEVGSIGMFVRDSATGTDCFMPCQAGVTSPEYYGLDGIYQPRLPENVRLSVNAIKGQECNVEHDDRHVTIRIPRSLLYYASAAAAAIVIFLSFSTPAAYTSPEMGTSVATANLFLPANLLPEAEVRQQVIAQPASEAHATHETQASASQPAAQTEVEAEEAPAPAPAVAPATSTSAPSAPAPLAPASSISAPSVPAEEAVQQTEYAVVLASAVSTTNAERYVQDLNARGIKAEMHARGNMVRVLVAGFKSDEAARQYARQLRETGSEFEASWVLKLQ